MSFDGLRNWLEIITHRCAVCHKGLVESGNSSYDKDLMEKEGKNPESHVLYRDGHWYHTECFREELDQ